MVVVEATRAKKNLSVSNRTDIVGFIIGVSNPSFYDVFHFTESRLDRFDWRSRSREWFNEGFVVK